MAGKFSNMLGNFMQAKQQTATRRLMPEAMAGNPDALSNLASVNPDAAFQVQQFMQNQEAQRAQQAQQAMSNQIAQERLRLAQDKEAREAAKETEPQYKVVGKNLVQVGPDGAEVLDLGAEETSAGLFEGTGMSAQAFNLVARGEKDPTIKDTPEYKLAVQYVTKPKFIQTEQGTMEIPGMDLAQITQSRAPANIAEDSAGEAVRATIVSGTEKDKKYNADQNKSYGFAGRMYKANQILEELVEGGFEPAQLFETATAEGMPMGLGNYFVSPEYQSYNQAKENWVTANLRKESGAVIGPEEMAKEIEKYFPIVGDSEKVIKQKAAARQDAQKAMIESSGRKEDEMAALFDKPAQEAPKEAVDMLMSDPTPEMKAYFKEQFGYLPEGV